MTGDDQRGAKIALFYWDAKILFWELVMFVCYVRSGIQKSYRETFSNIAYVH